MIFTSFVVAFAILVCVIPNTEEARLYNEFIRLHIIANSDSERDQTLKLKVRDAVLKKVDTLTKDCASVEEAESVFIQNKDDIAKTAAEVVKNNNARYDISVTLSDEYYPTREYEGIVLPAGVYKSARILIGEAQGKNWWCILFPPLCTNTAKAREKLVTAGFTQNQIRILTEGDNVKYKIKFRTLEIIQQIIAAFSDQ